MVVDKSGKIVEIVKHKVVHAHGRAMRGDGAAEDPRNRLRNPPKAADTRSPRRRKRRNPRRKKPAPSVGTSVGRPLRLVARDPEVRAGRGTKIPSSN